MAERRMFAKSVVESDTFLDMPSSAQALYFHLGMEADDEGFLNNPKRVQRSVGAAADDLKLLAAKGFVIPFDSGVIVLTHWKANNYLQKDRIKQTSCIEEKSMLEIDETKKYRLLTCVDTRCIHAVYTMDSECIHRLDKDRLDKDRLDKKKPPKHKHGEYNNVLLTDEDLLKLKAEFPNDWQLRIERLSEYMASTGKVYKSHLATIRNWARREAPKKAEDAKPLITDESLAKCTALPPMPPEANRNKEGRF